MVLGGCIGEATSPFLVALAMAHFGEKAFPICICSLIGAMVVTYLILHLYLKYTSVVQYQQMHEKIVSRQGSPTNVRKRGFSSNFSGTDIDFDFDINSTFSPGSNYGAVAFSPIQPIQSIQSMSMHRNQQQQQHQYLQNHHELPDTEEEDAQEEQEEVLSTTPHLTEHGQKASGGDSYYIPIYNRNTHDDSAVELTPLLTRQLC